MTNASSGLNKINKIKQQYLAINKIWTNLDDYGCTTPVRKAHQTTTNQEQAK